jgi:hypothetical protein
MLSCRRRRANMELAIAAVEFVIAAYVGMLLVKKVAP